MLIPSSVPLNHHYAASLSRRVNANSQHSMITKPRMAKLIKKGEC